MRDELQKQLFQNYPELFRYKTDPTYAGSVYFSVDCGDGWFTIIDELCRVIKNIHDNQVSHFNYKINKGEAKEEDRPQHPVIGQIKEKFGGLRVYMDNTNDEIEGAIHMAENMSFKTCDTCGLPGKVGGSGWMTTLCDTCRLDSHKRRSYSGPFSVAAGQLKIGDSNG
jgi:hypothetical protein